MKRIRFLIAAAVLLAAILPVDLYACSICFGDPNSPMTHGAKAAVFFLLGVVFFVLFAMLGMVFFWIRRAKLLQVQAAIHGESTE
jgi:hypothetical protein